jgi:hypothetical protein
MLPATPGTYALHDWATSIGTLPVATVVVSAELISYTTRSPAILAEVGLYGTQGGADRRAALVSAGAATIPIPDQRSWLARAWLDAANMFTAICRWRL